MPTADDLFRRTADPTTDTDAEASTESGTESGSESGSESGPSARSTPQQRRPSGRVRHDEKMTVYVTADELLDIEHARLELRRRHGLAVDRGRLVREAIAMALADLEDGGEQSTLVRRLTTG